MTEEGEQALYLYGRQLSRDALENENQRLRDALEQYANPLNWGDDGQGIRRVWLEPDSTTPDAYNGFEAARAALGPNVGIEPPKVGSNDGLGRIR